MTGRSIAYAALAAFSLGSPALADPPQPSLPKPFATPSVDNHTDKVDWPQERKPKVAGPFKVALWAENLVKPRWLIELPNGDVLAAETSASQITLLRRKRGGALARHLFLTNETGNLNLPFGMALVGKDLYVAATDGLWRYPYVMGATSIAAGGGVKVLELPAGGHATRNVVASRDRKKLYVTVGSITNVDETGDDKRDPRRAAITEYEIATGDSRIFASGLRNPNGLDWNPVTGKLWTAVNERDGLGDDLVPDYVTSVKPKGFYGWPYFYFGDYEDPRKAGERPDLADKSLVPDLAVGAHTSSLGLTFYTGAAFPKRYRGGMFIGQHGSWNRSRPAGYRVAFVPFDGNGAVAGPPQTFLSNFLADKDPLTTHGRPVGVLMLRDGSLLVADDAGNRIWRVTRDGPDDDRPSLAGLMLVDAEKDRPVYPLTDGAVLDPKTLQTSSLNVIASQGGPVGSVRFTLDGKEVRVENAPPFTIGGRKITSKGGVNYGAWTPSEGEHELVATPFSGPDATGEKGAAISVRFRLK